MKKVETIKSIFLFLLIALSVVLTFSIWTYTPLIKTIEDQPTIDISIAEKRKFIEIIKPYKMVFNFEEGLKGSSSTEEIEGVMKEITSWTVSGLTLIDSNFTKEKLENFVRKPNRMTMYFHGEIPLLIYDNIIAIEDPNIPEGSFNRLVIEWETMDRGVDLHFISTHTGLRYSTKAKLNDMQNFERYVLPRGRSFAKYVEVNPEGAPYIAVPEETVEAVRHTYYQEEVSPTRFRNALFTDPNAVRQSHVGAQIDEFQDDHAFMRVDTTKKTLNYVLPDESEEIAIPSLLLLDTIDYLNEHGGWTDDYRFTSINAIRREVKFQLFVHGLPVFSDATSTEITQVWGNNRIFRYTRPYYTLNVTLPFETEVMNLPSGVEVADIIRKSDVLDLEAVDEIMIGYFMKRDTDRPIFILEPTWFYLTKDNWVRFSPEQLGGELIGLE